MRLLLDTHIFLWYIGADRRLPAQVLAAIRDGASECFLSVASIWEATIKASLGKLPLPGPPERYLPRERERHRIASLAVEEDDIVQLARLPRHHGDPFDRLLIGQAIRHDLTIVTIDPSFADYPAKLLPDF